MSSKTRETQLWKWLRDGVADLKSNHIDRVDAEDRTDVDGCFAGHAYWIELKTEARPVRRGTLIRVGLSTGQVDWLQARGEAGAKVWVLVQVGSGAAARRYLVWYAAAEMVRRGVTEACLDSLSSVEPKGTAKRIIAAASGHLRDDFEARIGLAEASPNDDHW